MGLFVRPSAKAPATNLAVGPTVQEHDPALPDDSPQWNSYVGAAGSGGPSGYPELNFPSSYGPTAVPYSEAGDEYHLTMGHGPYPGIMDADPAILNRFRGLKDTQTSGLGMTVVNGYAVPTIESINQDTPNRIPLYVEGMQIRSEAGLNQTPSKGRGNSEDVHLPPLGFTDPSIAQNVDLIDVYGASAMPPEVPGVFSNPWTG